MKLIRFGEADKEKTGVILEDEYYDTSEFGEDYNEQFFESDGLNRLQKFIDSNKGKVVKSLKKYQAGEPGGAAFKNYLHWPQLCRPCKRDLRKDTY